MLRTIVILSVLLSGSVCNSEVSPTVSPVIKPKVMGNDDESKRETTGVSSQKSGRDTKGSGNTSSREQKALVATGDTRNESRKENKADSSVQGKTNRNSGNVSTKDTSGLTGTDLFLVLGAIGSMALFGFVALILFIRHYSYPIQKPKYEEKKANELC